MADELTLFTIITVTSLALLVTINHFIKEVPVKLIINFLFFSESVVLTFFFAKFPSFLSITIMILSFYFMMLLSTERKSLFQNEDRIANSIIPPIITKSFPFLGPFLIFNVVAYEYLAGWTFSSNDLLVICLSLIMIFFKKVPVELRQEGDFLLIFLSTLVVIFILPQVIYKVISDTIGQNNNVSLFDETKIVFYILGQPLAKLLSFLGYSVLASGQSIFFEDMEAGVLREVGIARSCAGLTSIQIFMAALISYTYVVYQKLDMGVFLLLVYGLLIAYTANLLRMMLIVLAGHYWGLEALMFVHKYAGWVIFTFWVFLFWIIVNKVIKVTDGIET